MTHPIDFGADTEVSAAKEALTAIERLVFRADEERALIARLTSDLKWAETRLRTIEEGELPDAMLAAGVREFETDSGRKVKLDDFIQAHISEERAPAAFAWLDAHGHGGLIKTLVTAAFGRGESDRAQATVQALQESGLEPELKQSVHASTLKSWVREMAKQGNPIPDELFGIFRGRKAIIK